MALSALNISVPIICGSLTPLVFLSIVIFELCTDTASSSITSFLFFFDMDSINDKDISKDFFIFSESFINIFSLPTSVSSGFDSGLSKDCSMNLSLDKFLS